MTSRRFLRLLPAAALVVTVVPAAAPATASWPGSNESIFVVAEQGTPGERTISRFSPSGEPSGAAGSDVTQFSNIATTADGDRLAYSKDGDIVVVDLNSFAETTVVSGPANDVDPAFSFDGRYLFYASDADGDQDVYVKDLTATSAEAVKLTDNTVDDWAPAFGSDGTDTEHGDLVAFVRLDGSDTEIFTMTPGGTDERQLTDNNVHDFGPNWHPSFDTLAYSSQDEDARDQIFTMSFDGTGKDQLTSDANYNYEPSWSPDGTKIAFTKQPPGVNQVSRIYVRPGTPGGTETPLTPEGSTSYDRAEWQAAPGSCQHDCGPGEPMTPVLFMNLRKHLVVSGGVEGPGGDGTGGTCGVGTPIKIQRFAGGKFKTIASATTNSGGTFSKKVPDKTGKYRLVSTEFTDEASGTTCLAARSPAKTHRHRRT